MFSRQQITWGILVFLMIGLVKSAFAGVRCNGQIVSVGDSYYKLLTVCTKVVKYGYHHYLEQNGMVYHITTYENKVIRIEGHRL